MTKKTPENAKAAPMTFTRVIMPNVRNSIRRGLDAGEQSVTIPESEEVTVQIQTSDETSTSKGR